MRLLRLQNPNMSGPDVSDWQTFLKSRGVLHGLADGVFGPKSDQATRAYQNAAGLTPDGIVGATCLAQAVTDGYQSTTGANLAGMDASVDCSPFVDQIAGAGINFAARYYSDSAAKTLTPSEARSLSQAGVSIISVFEDFNNSIDRFSAAIGAQHAAKALELAAATGQSPGTAIYFAVDFNPVQAEVKGPVTGYFTAVRDAFAGAAVEYAIGVYGSGLVCRLIRDAGLAKFTWLSQSTGFFEYSSFRAQADVVQLAPERVAFGGLQIDDNIAQSAEFGAFRVAQAQPASGVPT